MEETTLKERFVVEQFLSSGAMGAVYAARDLQIDRRVAVKVLRLQGDEYYKRFERECKALASFHSPYMPKIFTWGRCEEGPYLVMELIEGKTLEEHLQSNASFSPQTDLPLLLLLQICDALTEIHGAGLVHRDLKPRNIMVQALGDGPHICILDFGVVHLLDNDLRMTQTEQVLGSNGYMSPEHFNPSKLDPRSDIFALGCIMYRWATGQAPFEGEAPLARMLLLQQGRLPELPEHVPLSLKLAIGRCLQFDPESRFGSARELKEFLLQPDQKKHASRIKLSKSVLKPLLLTFCLAGIAAILITHAPTADTNTDMSAPAIDMRSIKKMQEKIEARTVTSEEIQNMEAQRPLVYDQRNPGLKVNFERNLLWYYQARQTPIHQLKAAYSRYFAACEKAGEYCRPNVLEYVSWLLHIKDYATAEAVINRQTALLQPDAEVEARMIEMLLAGVFVQSGQHAKLTSLSTRLAKEAPRLDQDVLDLIAQCRSYERRPLLEAYLLLPYTKEFPQYRRQATIQLTRRTED